MIHETYLPFTAQSLRQHFPAFVARDETLWTAGALVALHRSEDPKQVWRGLLIAAMGETPPVGDSGSWDDLLAGDELELYFEGGSEVASCLQGLAQPDFPTSAIRTASSLGGSRGVARGTDPPLRLLSLAPSTGFAAHFEAKVLSDVDTKTKHDALRNQLARNLDCLWDPAGVPALRSRCPDRSVLLLLTPELFRTRPTSRLYGHLFELYRRDPAALHRDLPHLSNDACEELSRRLGWITFEQIRDLEPSACRWLAAS